MLNNLLFSLSLNHPYYDDGLWQSVSVIADANTELLCQQYQLIIRQNPGVFELYYFGIGNPARFVQALTVPLVFDLVCTDPYWLNISDVPMDWKGQLNFSSGLLVADSQILSTQLAKRTVVGRSIIGQVSIDAADLLDAQGLLSQPQFAIKMQARQTQWRYFICNHTDRKFDHLVVNNADGIVFDGPFKVSLANGDSADMFSSGAQLFDFKQSFSSPFNLVDEGQDSSFTSANLMTKPILTALPIPDIEVLEIEQQQGGDTVYSPMYVYI